MCHCWKIWMQLLTSQYEHEARREEDEHHRKRDRHDLHHLRLHRVGDRRRRQLHLQERGDRVDDRQHEVRVGRRQVVDPADPRRVAQLDRGEQHPVEREEHRDLHEDRQAAAERIDLLDCLYISIILACSCCLSSAYCACSAFSFGRDDLHLRHRARARVVQRIERALDDDGHRDDRPAPVADDAVQPLEQPEERRRDHGEDAVVDDAIEALGERGEHVLVLRADVERNVDVACRAGRDRAHRHDDAGRVEAVVELARVELAVQSSSRRTAATRRRNNARPSPTQPLSASLV